MKINLKDLKIAIYQGEARAIKTKTASKLEAVCGFSRNNPRVFVWSSIELYVLFINVFIKLLKLYGAVWM